MKIGFINSTNAENHKIAIYQYGNYSNKAIILLHAFSHNALMFTELAEFLASKGHFVICPDMAGRGESDYLKNPRNYNYWLYVDDIFLIYNYFKLNNVSLFGNSMGGITSLLFAEKFPNFVKKIIFNDIGIFIPSSESMKIGSFVGQNMYHETFAEMHNRIITEMQEYNFSEIEIEKIFNFYTARIASGFKLNYDEKIKEAFWIGTRQIKIPDLDFTDNFKNLSKTNKDLNFYLIRGSESNLFSKNHFQEMLDFKNVKGAFEVPDVGHLPLFFNNNQKEIIADWLKD
jgi:cobalt-zinc-cadmium efflux system protein